MIAPTTYGDDADLWGWQEQDDLEDQMREEDGYRPITRLLRSQGRMSRLEPITREEREARDAEWERERKFKTAAYQRWLRVKLNHLALHHRLVEGFWLNGCDLLGPDCSWQFAGVLDRMHKAYRKAEREG